MPVYVPGEKYSFYLNFDEPINDPDFAAFRLDIRKKNAIVYVGIGPLAKDVIIASPGKDVYNIFSTFTFPLIMPGEYTFVIYNTAANKVMARSNIFLCTYSDPWGVTSYLHYRHSYNIYNYGFERLPEDFYIGVRLPMTQIELQFPFEKEEYRALSDRVKRNTVIYRDEVKKVETYRFTDWMHKAFTAALQMDGIFINLYQYTVNSAYNISNEPENIKAKGDVELIETGYVLTGITIIGDLGELVIYTGTDIIHPPLVFNGNGG